MRLTFLSADGISANHICTGRAGGNEQHQIKKEFEQIFGTSIRQFLPQHRMPHARELIVNRQIDVIQAAFLVGYCNVSHFIHYYKKTFGVTPGYDKQRRGSRIPPGIK